jgi:IS605 OrfB family transposase
MLFPSLRIAAHRAQGRIGHGHAYVANRRRNHLYKLSRDLVNRFGRIAVEDINIKALARGTLVKHVADAWWARLTAMLDYKAASGGVEHVRVDPRGTSQTCRSAGLSSKDDGRARTPLRMRWRSRAGTLLLRWSCTLLVFGSWPQRAVARQASGLRLAWIRSRRRKATVVHNRCGAHGACAVGLLNRPLPTVPAASMGRDFGLKHRPLDEGRLQAADAALVTGPASRACEIHNCDTAPTAAS